MAKLILTHEVTGLGVAGDVVEVKDGYANNYLVPRKLAYQWSKGAEKQIEGIRRARRARAIETLEDAQAVKQTIEARKVTVAAKAGTNGRLFGTVTGSDIADAIKAAGGPQVDKRTVEVPKHIKTLGEFTAYVRLHSDVRAKVDFTVVSA